MPNEGIDINSLYNRIEWLTKDCEDYQNKIKVLSDLFGKLSYEYNNCIRQLQVANKNNDKKFNLILKIQDFYKENDRMSKKQFTELLNKNL
jgi:uncharacterized protein Yka (UPF0111/DUF47 family)